MGIVPGHQFGSVEGLAEFVHSLVDGSSRFADVHGDLTLSTGAKKPKNAFVGLILNLQNRLLPGSPLDDPEVIDKEIFLIPFFTGDFFENF